MTARVHPSANMRSRLAQVRFSTSMGGRTPYGAFRLSPRYTKSRSGSASISARCTVSPPNPLSKTPIISRWWPLTCIIAAVLLEAALLSAAIVRSVSIPGTQMEVKLATQVGQPYDEAAVAQDVRTLWAIGRFSDVRAEAEEEDDGSVDVIFHVALEPRYSLHELRFE